MDALTRLYASAFDVLCTVDVEFERSWRKRLLRRFDSDNSRVEHKIAAFMEANEKFKTAIASAELKISLESLEDRVHDTVKRELAREIAESEKRISDQLQAVEDRVIDTVRRVLPDIIRTQLQSLLDERLASLLEALEKDGRRRG